MRFVWRPQALKRDDLKLGNATLCESPTFTPLQCCRRPVSHHCLLATRSSTAVTAHKAQVVRAQRPS